jgi:pyruvate dehydrogenase E2 component (dihydrolipoamide acetyltransferase)
MTDVLMPRLSDSMEEGTILTWLAADGDDIVEGQELVEVETDKATMTYVAEAAGVLQIVVGEGTTIGVDEPIARLAPAGSVPSNATGVDTEQPAVDAEPEAIAEPVAAPAAVAAPRNGAAIPATPMARRIADVHGVDLAGLTGSGPRGRVVRADVLAAAGLPDAPPAASPPTRAPAAAPSSNGTAADSDRVPLSRLQRLVARRMAEAKATVPHFQVQTEVEMSAAVAMRAQLKELAASQGTPVPSLNDLIVKASALALRRHPRANGSYADDGFELHERVNVGIAVASEDALVVPVVHDADRLTLGEIATESRRLAEAVRSGAVTPPELSGATFTVSNLGMYGMTAIVPVINPPQAAILGVGAIRDGLARGDDGSIVDRRLLTLTLSCDHRILYGADASQFLASIRAVLQAPLGLAL